MGAGIIQRSRHLRGVLVTWLYSDTFYTTAAFMFPAGYVQGTPWQSNLRFALTS